VAALADTTKTINEPKTHAKTETERILFTPVDQPLDVQPWLPTKTSMV